MAIWKGYRAFSICDRAVRGVVPPVCQVVGKAT